ncbi:Calmodulin-binding transcription activator 5 [Ananas comosus]|uniref:Calmodulin-binding transcription activator 5 n=1 Tax=Ananas comosus TaxID=4615 RepID=A0A199W1X9_ANACO|nr:Calmodulin-binding transcription activator 5 [Ananas comosus]
MEGGLLLDGEIHGFHTASDLDVEKLMEDAPNRWFRPNEVHAILSNYARFKIQPQPVDKPQKYSPEIYCSKVYTTFYQQWMVSSGTVLLFDRKMLRNFRKDGHNWKKKKDGKTVQEAHEKLKMVLTYEKKAKIGNVERIHVYYARCEDDPNFYRRSYWLLDKMLERIVLVHYRQTSETWKRMKGASTSEEINSGEDNTVQAELQSHEFSLHEINTLDWDDLLESPTNNDSTQHRDGDFFISDQQIQNELAKSMNNGSFFMPHNTSCITDNDGAGNDQTIGSYFQAMKDQESQSQLLNSTKSESQTEDRTSNAITGTSTPDNITNDVFLSQNSLGRWNYLNDDINLLDDLQLEPLRSEANKLATCTLMDQSSNQQPIFNITDVSPGWAYSTEETKVLVVGYFYEQQKHLMETQVYCGFGRKCVPAELVQAGVYRCTAAPSEPGFVNLYLTLDGQTPISQVWSFEYRSKLSVWDEVASSEDDNRKLKLKEFQMQMRLAHLLFSTSGNVSGLSGRTQQKFLKEAKNFASLSSSLMEKEWLNMLKLVNSNRDSQMPATEELLELVLRNKLQEWLLEKVAEGRRTTPCDIQGQGVIHLCAILDYPWAVYLFSLSGFSLDFRDACGWTALHWAAYYGRERMVATLLSAGANPSLVTDPTPDSPGGSTAADLAAKQGYEGLAAYLAEKGLTAHFQAMSLSGNVATAAPFSTKKVNFESTDIENLSEQELCLKESLAAYRNAADAADRIQAAFRERSLKLQTKAVQMSKPEMEASEIVAALKIQHAFRNHNRRKLMRAAAQIQSHFRTWKTRKNFLHVRRQVIRIQAAFRGHQVRKQYCKIIWSVGVLEKAILRWRLKRRGLRGIHTEAPSEAMRVDTEPANTEEEEFFRISREQAEERVKRSVLGLFGPDTKFADILLELSGSSCKYDFVMRFILLPGFITGNRFDDS